MRKPLIVGNWKMNGNLDSVKALAGALVDFSNEAIDVVVCPSFVHIAAVSQALHGSAVKYGAQNVYFEGEGAFTGEISATMLRDIGCQYVIVGHSERRQLLGEMDDFISHKISAVQAAGLAAIVCVGESLSERESGRTLDVVAQQMQAALAAKDFDATKVVFAYEPIWAIGTGKVASPGEAQEVHQFMRAQLPSEHADSVQILYGGSMKPDNAADLLSKPDIDGGLIGGASLQANSFLAICRAAI
jgi:triosephosphate isomerase (TIM)